LRKNRRSRNAVTMNEVAKEAGVSAMTVSRVLSGDAKVRDETQSRVRLAIRELGYSPNIAARNLARAATLHVGLLYSNPSGGYLNEFLMGALSLSGRTGCNLVVEKCSVRGERRAISKLLDDGVAGVILPPPLSESKTALDSLVAAGLPFVRVATGRPDPNGISVCINNAEAAATMTRHLVSLGHRKVGFIIGASNQSASQERYGGFLAALREAGIQPRPDWVMQGDFSYRSGLLAAEQMLSSRDRPSAIFASNDDMAAGAVAVAHRLNIAVPLGLTVAGFDDTPLATTIWPTLSTIRQPIAAMSRKALELLLEEIRLQRLGKSLGPVQHFLDFSLVMRESSGPCQ
jgi:LacI family transcriptional regulator